MDKSTHIFKQLLGAEYQQLPPIIQEFHDSPHIIWQGKATASGATNLLAKLMRKLMGFPEPANGLTVTVNVSFTGKGEERWTRNFGDKAFSSVLALDPNNSKQMYEKFGLVKQYFTLEFTNNWLCWRLKYCTCLGIKLPRCLQPKVIANEGVSTEGNYQFIAQVTLPVIGVLIDYQGHLNKVINPL